MLGARTCIVPALCVALLGGAPAYAQRVAPAGEPKRVLKVSTQETLPPGYEELAGGPESPVRRVSARDWSDVAQLTVKEIEAEAALLRQERAVRVRGVAGFQAQIQEREDRVRRNPTETAVKNLDYRRALVGYRIAGERDEIRVIDDRLEVLSQERARRSTATATPTAHAARDLENVRAAREAMELLSQYDAALQELLRHDPVSETEVIRALSLLDKKANVAEILQDYLRILEEEAAALAEASEAPEPEDAP